MEKLLLVMLGGALGSGARWLVGVGVASKMASSFPFATLIVNVIGSFVMGIVAESASLTPERRAFVATGLLGGFTTYSAFNQETIDFVNGGAWSSAVIYAAATASLCLGAGFAGMATGRAIAAS